MDFPNIGWPNPIEATRGPREKLIYVTCVSAKWKQTNKPDFLATIDVDPDSNKYSQIIHKLEFPYVGDELHHTGWNACSSCRLCNTTRNRLIVPGINSDRIYIVDTETCPTVPKLFKVIEPEELHNKGKASAPHTVHCLPSGDIMISCLGDPHGGSKGTFILLEQRSFEIKGTWQEEKDSVPFNYDYWYQPRHNVMISTEWTAPKRFKTGFSLHDFQNGLYGRHINIWNWNERKLIQRLDVGEWGQIPLEIRFLHNPEKCFGFVGCALPSCVIGFWKEEEKWIARPVIKIPPKKVENWILPEMPGLITDILVSLDDRYLYVSNWIHGDIRQYDISNPKNPIFVSQIFLGGSLCKGSNVKVIHDEELDEKPRRPVVKGIALRGGPQMLQLSLDGKRLYVTNSLFSAWDEQFYPENIEKGSLMVLVNVDRENKSLTLDKNFLVDFGTEGNILAHEMRFPGGDSTSDIWE